MNILEELTAGARERIREAERRKPFAEVRREAEAMERGNFPFERALRRPGLSFICECKRASPSRGLIAAEYPCVSIAKDYEAAGADAVSVLTEPSRFLGADSHLREIAAAVSLPCLRKDFTAGEYMIYEAKTLGAAAVLLICAVLSEEELREYGEAAASVGLSALVEAHDGAEIEKALRAGAKIIGVNNRDLRDFSVDTGNSRRLRALVPEGVLFVAESGVRTAEDAASLAAAGADAVLVGEALMGAADRRAKLRELRGGAAAEEMTDRERTAAFAAAVRKEERL